MRSRMVSNDTPLAKRTTASDVRPSFTGDVMHIQKQHTSGVDRFETAILVAGTYKQHATKIVLNFCQICPWSRHSFLSRSINLLAYEDSSFPSSFSLVWLGLTQCSHTLWQCTESAINFLILRRSTFLRF